ncbi:MAG: hypothetical protein SNJ57_00480 [Cyanobacteriota bacterium]
MLNQLDALPEAAAEERAARSVAQSTESPKVRSVAQSATQPVPVLLELPFGDKLPPASQGDRPAVAINSQVAVPTVSRTLTQTTPQTTTETASFCLTQRPSAPETSQTASSNATSGGAAPSSPTLAQAVSSKAASTTPDLPGFPFTPLAATRHATDPALALGILREIEGTLLSWQRELQRLQLEIQELHMEGPIIDGWLESQPATPPPPEAEFIRHAEIDALMGYVQTLCDTAPDGMIQGAPRAGYRLCGLDADGKVWSRECPPERVPQVSLAIARCQKVRQLVTRKNDLESRLSKLAERLVSVHSELMT